MTRPVRATFIWADGSHPLCACHVATRAAATGESHTLWDRVSVEGVPCATCEAERELREERAALLRQVAEWQGKADQRLQGIMDKESQ